MSATITYPQYQLIQSAATATELVFIMDDVADWQTLAAGVKPDAAVVLLDSNADPLQQMATALTGRSDLDAIHLISHGSEGSLQLGSQTLNSASLQQYSDILSQIGSSLKPDGDILLYGCNVAQGQTGLDFIGQLAQATGADVAASDDATGSNSLGGDWVLEQSTATIETQSLEIVPFVNLLATPASQNFNGATATNGSNASSSLTLDGVIYSINGAGVVEIDSSAGSYIAVEPFAELASNVLTANYGLTYTDGVTTFTIRSSNLTDDFKLNSLVLGINNTNYGTYTIAGYSGGSGGTKVVETTGVNIQSATTSFGTGAAAISFTQALATGNSWGGTLTFGSAWDNIDTVVFTATNGYDLCFSLDAISFSDPTPVGPTITSATYDASSNLLSVTATGMTAGDSIDETKLTLTGQGGGSYTLTEQGSIVASSATVFSITLNSSDAQAVEALLNKNGTTALGGTAYNIAGATGWNASQTTAADTSGNGITVSSANPNATLTFESGTGTLSSDMATSMTFTHAATASTFTMTTKTLANADGIVRYGSEYGAADGRHGNQSIYVEHSDKAKSFTFAIEAGKIFDLLSFYLSNQNGSGDETFTITTSKGGSSSGTSGASGAIDTDQITLPATANFQGITWFTITAPAGGAYMEIDDIQLGNIVASAPAVTNVTASTANGSYKVGDTISIQIAFSEAVTVDTSGGTPYLTLETGTADRNATYTSGSGSSTLTFSYTIQAGDTSADLDYLNTTALALNGGTINATTGATAATLTLASPGAANSLGANKTIVIDTTPPTVSITMADTALKIGETSLVTFTFNEAVTGFTNADLTIANGTISPVSSSNGGITWTATFTPDADVTDTSNVITINKTGVADLAGNAGSGTTDSPNYAIDTNAPTDISLSNSTASVTGGANTVVGALSTTDTTPGDTFTYSLVAGAGDTNNGSFNINGANLRVTDPVALGAGTYSVRVRTTDAAGNSFDEVQSITITNGPTISSASYDAGTGILSVTGADMTTGDTIAVNKLTLTGEGGATCTLTTGDVTASSATAFSVTLNATDQAAVNQILNKNGTSSTSGTTFNLAAADDWDSNVTAGDTSDATNAITVSNVAVPVITSATYDYATNVLTVTGTGFLSKTGANNDIDLTKLTITGEAGATYTFTNATGVEITSSTSFTTTLSGADLTNVEALLNKDGTSAVSATTYNLSAAASWNRGDATGGSDTTNTITVSNYAAPAITSATFDASTNILTITGTNFVSKTGATNDVTVSLLSLTGEGGTYTLTSSDVEITSATSFAVTLNAADQLYVHGLLNKNGTQSSGATTYNLAAAEDWMAGSAATTVVADLTGNGVTVSNVQTPTITSATYDSDSGVLTVTGTNLFHKVGTTNDIDLTKLTLTGGTGNATYTLTSSTGVEITSATSFSVTLSGSDKTNVDALLDQIGTSSSGGSTYNLAAADHWLAGADTAANIADATNAVTVSINPGITSATYDAATGTLVVTGSNMQAKAGAANDITATKLTFTGEGGATYTLTDTADVELTSATAFTLALSATDKAAINQIVNKNGTSSTGATTYNLAAADDWDAQVTAGDTSDTTGNGITVSNVAVPAITNATYDAATGAVVVTGTGFLKLSGVTNDIVANKFTFTGEGGATYTLTDTANFEITSGTAFTITLSATDKAAINQIINKNGTASTGGTTYNLAAAEDWAAGADAAVVIADTTGNGITASNVAVPAITSSTYDSSTGTLVVTGTGFLKLSGATNDIVANKFTFTGEGGAGAAYTLTDTANVEITSGTSFTITLSSTDKTAVNLLINKTGTSSNDSTTYNLAAAEDWAAGADAAVVVADLLGNGITATINAAPVITSNGGGATASINVAENTTAVTTVTATDADAGQTITYSITGGADAAKFSIVGATGILTFATAPNFEAPTDSDHNNSYIVEVTANDGHGGTDLQTITTIVTDVNENLAPTLGNIPGSTQQVTTAVVAALPDFTVTDADGDSLTLTLTATNGTIGGLTDADPATAGIQLIGIATQINTALAAATFTATAAGAATINFSLSDGVATPVTGSYNLQATAPVVTPVNPPVDPPVTTPVTPPTDDDNDGITATTENQVPSLPPVGGGTAVVGDGNGDGIADNQQASVTSVPFLKTTTAVSNPTGAPPVYVTLVGGSNAGIPDTTTGHNVQLTSVQQKDAPTNLPADIQMPLGLISFTANVGTTGISETFSLFVDSSVTFNGYWKQNAAGTWCNIATAIETVGGKTRIDFAITDGGAFDADGKADGIITDPGAIGSMPLSMVGELPVTTGTGFWF